MRAQVEIRRKLRYWWILLFLHLSFTESLQSVVWTVICPTPPGICLSAWSHYLKASPTEFSGAYYPLLLHEILTHIHAWMEKKGNPGGSFPVQRERTVEVNITVLHGYIMISPSEFGYSSIQCMSAWKQIPPSLSICPVLAVFSQAGICAVCGESFVASQHNTV